MATPHMNPPQTEFFNITDNDLRSLKDKVIVITGIASGIGLATTKIALSLGAKVVGCDVNDPPIKDDGLIFMKVDVRSWEEQRDLFKKAIEVHGRVDHVFANAGIGPTDSFVVDKLDSNGDLLPPNMKTMDINLTAAIYTSKLAIHHMRRNPSYKGALVITASASSFSPFAATDYGVAKHGTLGLMRNLHAHYASTGIRVNCITPLWTSSGLVPGEAMKEYMGINAQPPEAAARSALVLMADEERKGQTMYSKQSKFKEVDGILLGAISEAMDVGEGDFPTTPEQAKAFQQMVMGQLGTQSHVGLTSENVAPVVTK